MRFSDDRLAEIASELGLNLKSDNPMRSALR